ncbi:uncharacterized protein [Amphiura filiformis]|uniref:uncharacterized protein n=1 Tax=Amphiura filiformis TaxID=82378 RepID=UPI003B220799
MMVVFASYYYIILFALCGIYLKRARSEMTDIGDTIRCQNQHVLLQESETITIQTYENETCNFSVSSFNDQRITVNVLRLSSWSFYDYFTLHVSGEECANLTFAWIGSTEEACAIVLNCTTIHIDTRALSLLKIQSTNLISPTHAMVGPGKPSKSEIMTFNMCANVHTIDVIYNIQYHEVTNARLQELNPSLQIKLKGDPYFKPDELPGFDLGLQEGLLLAEFPECPIGCFCSLEFQLFLIDCPDIQSNRKMLLEYKPLDLNPADSTVIDIVNRQVTRVEPYIFFNMTDVIMLLLSKNRISIIGPGTFRGLDRIHTLDLSYNQISSIELDSFSHMNSLNRLLLNVNKLTYISHTWLAGLVNVQVLYLGGNPISNTEPDVFSDMTSLKVLSLPDSQVTYLKNLTSKLLLFDLSSNNFTRFPMNLLTNLTHLSLDNNQISFQTQTIFHDPSALLSLVLSRNGISFIPNNLFSHLHSLKRLNLGNNALTDIQIDLFSGLRDLEVLYLRNNSIESLPSGVFVALQPLQVLLMYDNKLKMIENDLFNGLTKLGILELSSNIIESLPSGVFRDLQQLQELYLYDNKLKNIEINLLKGLTKLEILSLSSNNIESLPSGVFRDLHQLQELHLYDNKLKKIESDLLNGLTKLEILNLGNNSIESLPSGVFRDLHQLQELHLYDNKLKKIEIDLLNGLTKLEILNLGNNSIESLPSGVFRDLHQLQELNLYYNKLKKTEIDFLNGFTKLEILHLSNNIIKSLPSGLFRDLHQLQELYLYDTKLNKIEIGLLNGLIRLELLNLGNNIITPLPSGVFRDLHQLQKLYLYDNILTKIETDLLNGLTKLEILSLGNNSIESLQSGVFRDLHQLQKLYLYDNKLKKIEIGLLNELTKLEILNLGNNSIESLQSGVFRDLYQLHELYLYDNKLKKIEIDLLNGLTKLELLNLGNNSIESLPSGVFSLSNLSSLMLNNNMLKTLPSALFKDLKSLEELHLYNNRLTELPEDIFHQSGGMPLKLLTIYSNNITKLYPYQFANLTDLALLGLSDNQLNEISSISLYGLTKLKFLNLVRNNITKVTKTSFMGFTLKNHSFIAVDNPATCCFLELSNRSQCVPEKAKSPYLTCKQLLPSIAVKLCTWIFGFVATSANIVVFVWGCKKIIFKLADKGQVKQIVLITNLALADLLMGLYLLIVACVDQYYSEQFVLHAEYWRNSILCKFNGFLSVLSSEASLLFLTLIGVDRFWAFRKIFITRRLFGKKTQIVLAIFAWVTALALSIVTVAFKDDQLYQNSDVCIGLPLIKRKIYREEYPNITISYDFDRPDTILEIKAFTEIGSKVGGYFSIGIFLGLNFLLCLLIAIFYILLFIHIWKSGFSLPKTDLKIAIKMGVISLTDLMCWLPIVILGILAQTGIKELPSEWIPWVTTFALPINSVLNPFLYATVDRVSNHFVHRLQPNCYMPIMDTML